MSTVRNWTVLAAVLFLSLFVYSQLRSASTSSSQVNCYHTSEPVKAVPESHLQSVPDLSYDQIYLFGDSLTDFAIKPGGWVNRLTVAYSRKADVVNRGVSALNSWNLRYLVPSFLRESPPNRIKLITILIGTNDFSISSFWTHVDLDVYKENLNILFHCQILVMTPPPMSTRSWKDGAYLIENAVIYRDACIETVTSLQQSMENVELLNLWDLFVPNGEYKQKDWNPSSVKKFFYDDGLMKAITTRWPELNPENMPHKLPFPHEFPVANSKDVEGLKKVLFKEARKP
ncbi:SGNH hydrolase [Rhizoclosmatium globosum]|uniref:SGNH hydrolase n=1 Tax=Rhizoclosmatium globosum TaxID=329046 RepID=A0A1Y2CB16_9FUNG|nr:SGNH hydrolase [Rhizoclosmatium globosum]|eukprot:ORY44034.1 SGNH hydrolase [Rhizoclosmatium globosum]